MLPLAPQGARPAGSNRPYWLAVLLAGVGMTLSIWAAIDSLQPATTSSFLCGEQGSACQRAYNSAAGKLGGIPIAYFGVVWFAATGLYLLLAGSRAASHASTLIPAGVSLVSSILLLLALMGIGAFCGLCLLVHAANLGLIAALVWMWLRAAPTGGLGRLRWCAALAAVSFPIGLVGVLSAFAVGAQARHLQEQFNSFRTRPEVQRGLYQSASVYELPVAADDPVLGPADAPLTLVVFKDFQCQACQRAGLAIKQILREPAYAGRLRVVFKHSPYSYACNLELARRENQPQAVHGPHAFACRAAVVAQATHLVHGNDAFWKFHDLLYERQAELPRQDLLFRELLQQLQLDPEPVLAAADSPAVLAKIGRDTTLAARANVRGLPAVYLQGRSIDAGWFQPESFRALLDYALSLPPADPATTAPSTQPQIRP